MPLSCQFIVVANIGSSLGAKEWELVALRYPTPDLLHSVSFALSPSPCLREGGPLLEHQDMLFSFPICIMVIKEDVIDRSYSQLYNSCD